MVGKIKKLLPALVVPVFLLFSALVYFSGGGSDTIRQETWAEETTCAVEAPVRSLPSEQARINVNTADRELLQTLPGIGPVRADRIVAYREENGPFSHLNDLLSVKGIGKGILESIRDLICLEDEDENFDH